MIIFGQKQLRFGSMRNSAKNDWKSQKVIKNMIKIDKKWLKTFKND